MLNVSNAFNEAFKNPTRQVLVRVTMKNIVYTNNDIFNVEYVGGSITGETFNIGSVFSNSIKITFTKVIEAVKQLDKIRLEFGIVLADGSKEFVSMGYFFVDKYNPDRNANRTIIEALDQMTQLERVYKSKLTYPARIKDVALEIANLSGSVVDQVSFERLSTNAINKIEGKTYRQAIGLIAQFAGGFAIFDRDGKLSIRTLSDPNFAISTAEYFSRGLVKNETMYTLGGISCKVSTKNGDTTSDFMLQSGSPLGNQIALENSSMTQILLDSIYQQLKDTNYYPYTLSWRGNPALEAGDWISMSDTKANSFKMPNLSYKLSFSGGLKATSSADTSSVSQASASYRGPINQQLIELQGWKSAAGGWTYTGTTEPSTPKEGDVWFKPNGPDTETWIFENGKWVFQTSTAGIRQVKEEMNQAQKDIQDAVKSANDAVDKANQNIREIGELDVKLIDTKTLTDKAQNDATKAITDAKTAYDKATENSGKIVTVNQEIDKVKGEITQKVSQTDFDKSLGRITQAESSISQNANSITQKVSQIDVENILTGKAYATKSELTQTSNSLTSTISGVQSNLDNLTLGGVNILATTTDAKTFQGQGIVNQQAVLSYLTKTRLADYNLKVGDKVSFSCICEISGSNFSGVFYPRLRTSWTTLTQNNASYSITKAEKIKFTCTFIMTEGRLSDGTGIDFRADNVPSTVSMKWSEVQLEVGDKPTGYAPAPEEKANQIQVTQLSQDLDGFKTTVSDTYLTRTDASTTYPTKTAVTSQINQKATDITSSVQSWTNDKLTGYSTIQQTNNSITSAVADKADRTQVTQLSDNITSTVTGLTNESLITTQMMKDTTLVHPNFNTMPMVEVPVINGETYTVSTNQPWEGNAAHVWYIRVTSTTPASGINGVYDGKSITLPALSDKIYIVFRSQAYMNRFINGQYWVKVVSTSATKSQITQLSNDINLRVAKGDVTSQINLESGRVLIDSKQLLLNADNVKFSGSAFIPSASIQNLSADKINTGTLNAGNVNITNLNASNIKTGTLSGTNLSMNLNTGAVKFKQGYIEGSDGRIRLDLDNSYFKSFDSSNNGFEIRNGILKIQTQSWGDNSASILPDIIAEGGGVDIVGNGGVSLTSSKYTATIGVGSGGLANGTSTKLAFQGNAAFWNDMSVLGKKNAIHVTRDGVRATPAYETAESYLGDIGSNYTREDCEVWVPIDELFSDTVNTDIAYHVFLQAYDDAQFWVAEFKSDKFLIKSNKPMARFAWEIKAKRRGYENDRLVLQNDMDNEQLIKAFDAGALEGDSK